MPRLAVADLMVDLELPAGPEWTYDAHGTLTGTDPAGWQLDASGLVVTPRDGAQGELGAQLIEREAAQLGVTLARSPAGAAWLRCPPDPADGTHQHWKLALGNRVLVVTLTSEAAGAERVELMARVEASLETVKGLVPSAGGQVSDAPQYFPLVPSQELWFAVRRRDLVERLAHLLPTRTTDALPTPEVLDELWAAALAASPGGDEVDHLLNVFGVALGDHLVNARRFVWSLISDEWGAALGVVAEGEGGGQVATDPFSFVAKRWERREPRFFVEGIRAVCRHVDEVLGEGEPADD